MDSVQQACPETQLVSPQMLVQASPYLMVAQDPLHWVLNHAELLNIHTYLHKVQLCWAGHVLKMADQYLQKCPLFGELIEGKRSIGSQKKCFKDTLKAFSLSKTSPLILIYGKTWQNPMHCSEASYESQ